MEIIRAKVFIWDFDHSRL